MMPNLTSSPTSFTVDPIRDGLATSVWAYITGTPTVASSKFRFNTAEGLVKRDIRYANISFSVVIPLTGVQTPTNLVNNLSLGLRGAATGTLGKIELLFSKSGNSVAFRTYNEFGTIQSTTLAYATAWNGVATVFEFNWANDGVSLYVTANGGTAKTLLAKHSTSFPTKALSPNVVAVGAENFDVAYIAVQNAQSISVVPEAVASSSSLTPTTLTGGSKTVTAAGTGEALGSTLVCKSIYIRAKSTNTTNVYVGDSAVDKTTSKQIILAPNDYLTIAIANRATVYLDVDTSAEGVDYLVMS